MTTESYIEGQVTKFAEKQGWLSIKLNGPGDAGKPDRLYLGKGGEVVLIEFKAPGQRPRKLQLWWARRIRRLGFHVYFIDNVEVGRAVFK